MRVQNPAISFRLGATSMPDLQRPDVSLHYVVSGDGPPLVLLSGLLSDNATWAPLMPFLEPHFTVIRPDNRTTGRTTPWDAKVTVQHMAQDAIALMDHLGYARFHVAGHSMGGLMGIEIAGLVPDRVAGLSILASGAVRIARAMHVFDTLLSIRRASPDGETLWLKTLYPWIFRPKFFDNPDNTQSALETALAYPHAQTADAMALQIEALRSFRPETRPESLKCPVQTLLAGQDLIIPPDAARKSFDKIPDVEHHLFEDAGHSIVWDAPDWVAERLIEFANRR